MTLPEKEVHPAYAKPTHAVDILAFIEAQEIPALYFETPYRLAPAPGGEKVYDLLREALRSARKIGIAYVVIQARQHLAALVPEGQSLMLTTLRWASETMPEEQADWPHEELNTSNINELELMLAMPKLERVPGAGNTRHSGSAVLGDMAGIGQQRFEADKTSGIMVEELDDLLDDEEEYGDDYIASALRRSMHTSTTAAARRARLSMPTPSYRGEARTRRRRH